MLVANEHFWNVPSVIFNATRICESDWISQWLFRSSNTLATIIVLISTIIPMSWVKQWIRYNQMYIRANSSMGVRILSGQNYPPRFIRMLKKWPLPSASASTSAAWRISENVHGFYLPTIKHGEHCELGNRLSYGYTMSKSWIEGGIQYWYSMTIIQNPAINTWIICVLFSNLCGR